ncbi:MAG: tetratricopeptide repeat protein [Burkholderiales bacterium]|jgi:tetratricopeptide (TPR) repeat protein|nr:tetratricopeptide repeat protein [Burkholderiales bacterium]
MTFKPAAAHLATILFCMGLTAPVLAQNDDLQEAQQLLKQGQTDRAMERVDQYLKTRPKDARGRFLRGILLTEQNKPADAIRVFTELTQDYPELPEPYNNLAVLYASQGQYDKARGSLEMAIRTHPSYATAHENLGDIYAKMASQAYDKALQLDKGNQAAQTKLNLIKDLFTGGPRPPKVAALTQNAPKAAATAPTPAPAARPITPAPAAPAAPQAVAPKTAAAPVANNKEPAKEAAKEPAPLKTAPPANNPDAVLKAVDGWATAWANNDVDGYLARYAPGFKTPDGEPRKEWEAERRTRIAKPRKIEVRVEAPKVTFNEANRATVTFRQHYRSNTFKASANKTLVLVRSGNQWLIQEEIVGG